MLHDDNVVVCEVCQQSLDEADHGECEAQEVYESWVNGNGEWVTKRVASDSALKLAVGLLIACNDGTAEATRYANRVN